MTQSSLQTQCPHCQTRFRVTDEQLGIARGKVRCGNCMEVFNATEHRVTPGSAKPGKPTTPESQPTGSGAPPSADNQHITEEDFVFADNPEEDAAHGPYAGSELKFSDDELSDSFRTAGEPDGMSFQSSDDDIARHDIDESWADAILESDTQREPEPEPAPPEEEDEPEFHRLPEHSFTPPPPAAPIEETLEEMDEEIADEFVEPREPISAGMPFTDLRREPLSVRSSNKGKFRTVVWSLIVLVLAGALIAQVTWFQFDRLSAIPELRPFYEKGCQLVGCHLKPLISVDAIQSRKLVVRTDPENRSQLLVDAVIINRADFEQPFPAIALTFSNLNGDVVAQSIFTPSEYLAGEGVGLKVMPKETPIRIAISIRDPGRDAVNYNIAFRPASP